MWFTNFGKTTKTIYLYHVFFAISASTLYDLFDNTIIKLFVMIVVTFLICFLTGNKYFVKYTKYTTELYKKNSKFVVLSTKFTIFYFYLFNIST